MPKCSLLQMLAAVTLLTGCVVPNLGGIVDSIGREVVVIEPNRAHPKDLVIYELDDAYYVEVQGTWQHVKACSCYSWDPYQGRCGGFHLWSQHDKTAPKETFLIRLSSWSVEHLLQKKVPEDSDDRTYISSSEFDYTRAKRCTPRPKLLPQYPDNSKPAYGAADEYYTQAGIPVRERYSWLHVCTQPLAWAAEIIDVPLTVTINAPIYVLLTPYLFAQEALIQTGVYAPWEDEKSVMPVVELVPAES